jgi:8-amino-7-oxononanoate synthase
MNSLAIQRWKDALAQRKDLGLLRELKTALAPIDFSSNDYLGLARNPILLERVEKTFRSLQIIQKLGSTGSRLISGHHPYFEETEEYIAKVHQAESALLFNTGYMANLAVFSTLPQKGDTVLYDELSHACIKDGIRLSLANRFPFLHNDLGSLEAKLKKATGQIFVAVESVYSMDGDFAPLKELVDLCEKYQAMLIVDEAHSTGIFGKNGAGLVCHWGLQDKVALRVHTYGKAMGSHGASVVGPKELKPYLINFARPFIYTTAVALHGIVSIREAYSFLETEGETLQKTLAKNITLFNQLTRELNHKIQSESAIHALLLDGNERTVQKAKAVQSQGFDVRPVLSPTVKKGSERLRICLHAYNSEEEIKKLSELLSQN